MKALGDILTYTNQCCPLTEEKVDFAPENWEFIQPF
jgi:hypothetical protein